MHKIQVLGLYRNNFHLSLHIEISGRYLTLNAEMVVLCQAKSIP